MTDRERFRAVMGYERPDRMCAYYFGQWWQARNRWLNEGLCPDRPICEQVGLDPDWELGMWDTHGLRPYRPIFAGADVTLEETQSYRIVRQASGAVIKEGKGIECIPQHLKEALEPTRESWARFRKGLDLALPQRQLDAERLAMKAQQLNGRAETVCCFGGSLYGDPRDWMGVEAISMLAYDDPSLYEEIVEFLTDYYIAMNEPILRQVKFEFAYIFEDCCGKSGPLFSPETYRRYYDKYYRKLVAFYKSRGVGQVLLDSDGDMELLVPCWLDSGIDIIFPIEVGTWGGDPVRLRQRFGKWLRMMGGVDKHLLSGDPRVLRAALERLRPVVEEGGFIPLPDHRLPPSCSFQQLKDYVTVFKEVFGPASLPRVRDDANR